MKAHLESIVIEPCRLAVLAFDSASGVVGQIGG